MYVISQLVRLTEPTNHVTQYFSNRNVSACVYALVWNVVGADSGQ